MGRVGRVVADDGRGTREADIKKRTVSCVVFTPSLSRGSVSKKLKHFFFIHFSL